MWSGSGTGTGGRRENRGASLPGSAIGHVWWRWRESNPRPEQPPVGVYKLSLAVCLGTSPPTSGMARAQLPRDSPRQRKRLNAVYPLGDAYVGSAGNPTRRPSLVERRSSECVCRSRCVRSCCLVRRFKEIAMLRLQPSFGGSVEASHPPCQRPHGDGSRFHPGEQDGARKGTSVVAPPPAIDDNPARSREVDRATHAP